VDDEIQVPTDYPASSERQLVELRHWALLGPVSRIVRRNRVSLHFVPAVYCEPGWSSRLTTVREGQR